MSHPGTRKHFRARQWTVDSAQNKRGRSKQYDQTVYDGSQEEEQ